MAGRRVPQESQVMDEDVSEARSDNHPDPLPAWAECEVFCIHSYAGEAGSPCGWRGKLAETVPHCRIRVCPRCGRSTLLPIRSGH
jgi:hypothetical protein